MRKLILISIFLASVGCENQSQEKIENPLDKLKSYQIFLPNIDGDDPDDFILEENIFIFEEECLLKNAQQCRMEGCNEFIPEYCQAEGEKFTRNIAVGFTSIMFELIPIPNSIPNRIEELNLSKINAHKINEEYDHIGVCLLKESNKCKTEGCINYVRDYCDRFNYFKGEKEIRDKKWEEEFNKKYAREKEERQRIYTDPNSTLEDKVKAYCNANITWNIELLYDLTARSEYSCEEWYLLPDETRKELGYPESIKENPPWRKEASQEFIPYSY